MHPFIILFFSGTPEKSMKPNTLTTVGHYIKNLPDTYRFNGE
jgi:hypothetical protein